MSRIVRPWGLTKPSYGSVINWNDPITVGLKSFLLMNENAGSSIVDLANNSNIYTFNGATGIPRWDVGKFNGKSISFLKSGSQYLSLSSGIITTAPLTISCWFNSSSTATAQGLVGVYNSGSSSSSLIAIQTVANKIAALTNGNAAVSSIGASLNFWNHACGVFSSASLRNIYLNGGNNGSNSTVAAMSGINSVNIGRIGGSSPTNYMNGKIDLVMLWNRALDPAEVLRLYQDPLCVIMPIKRDIGIKASTSSYLYIGKYF